MSTYCLSLNRFGQVRTENSNKPHGFGILDPNTFTPFPKNPVIGSFFREIHRADELGSGMRKLMKYGRIYGGSNPELIEGDVFRITVKVPESSPPITSTTPTAQVAAQVAAEVTAQVAEFCQKPKSAKEIMTKLGLKHRKTFQNNYLIPMLDAGILEMTQPESPRSPTQKYRFKKMHKKY
jgi:ATP-dependent DNA helicase RecG